MKDIVAVMQDVSALITRGSDVARTEAQRSVAERQRRLAANGQGPAEQPAAADTRAIERTPRRFLGWLSSAWPRPL